VRIPDWWEAALLALAAWRVFQLLAFDDILDQPRRYVTRMGKDWQEEGDPVPKEARLKLTEYLQCPFCFGALVGTLWWAAWLIWPHATLVFAVPWALSAGVIAGHRLLSGD
jgi:hypothetical protein